tara:strand:- start:154 stop:432 length:279 start_codon:yes stop_codon:yes gene_type:complete
MSNKDRINKEMETQRKYKSQFDNVVNKVPYLKKIKDNAEGLTHRGDIISGDNSQEYKNNYDKIVWTKREEAEKPKFRTKVNGRYVDEDQSDD